MELQLNEYLDLPFQISKLNGEYVDADALPTFRIYAEGSDTPIETGDAAKRDNANTVGYYVVRTELTVLKGYAAGTIYQIRVTVAVGGVAGAKTIGLFEIVSADVLREGDLAAVQAKTDLINTVQAIMPFVYSVGAVYCQPSDIEDIYGVNNVAKWADLDNDGDAVKIANRKNRACVVATGWLEANLRGGPYLLPLTGTDPLIVNLAAQYAGVWLYESRGVQDFDATTGAPQHRLTWNRQAVDRTLKAILAGQLSLDAPRVEYGSIGPGAPRVVR